MTYTIVTPRPTADRRVAGGFIRPAYRAVIVNPATLRAAVVVFDEGTNEVRCQASTASPCYSDKAIDYVAHWMGPGDAMGVFKRAQRAEADASNDLADLRARDAWDSEPTTAQIRALRDEAATAGDLAQVDLCERAIRGDARAIRACARVITRAAG